MSRHPANPNPHYDEKILGNRNFDTSNQIRVYLENQPPDQLKCLNLLSIKLPGRTEEGNTVLPFELDLLNPGAIGSLQLTIYNVNSRDGCCSITGKNSGVTLLTNGPAKQDSMPTVDVMSMLKAGNPEKRRRIEAEA